MPSKHDVTKASILTAGLKMFLRRGFAGAGLTEILRTAKIPRGSFYHYFPGGKDEFVVAVIEAYVEHATASRRSILGDPSQPATKRLRRHFDAMADDFAAQSFVRGCLLGNLAGEAADEFPDVKAALVEGFRVWADDLEAVLEEASKDVSLPASPAVTARMLVAGWEGAVLLMKSEGNVDALSEFVDLWFGVLLA